MLQAAHSGEAAGVLQGVAHLLPAPVLPANGMELCVVVVCMAKQLL